MSAMVKGCMNIDIITVDTTPSHQYWHSWLTSWSLTLQHLTWFIVADADAADNVVADAEAIVWFMVINAEAAGLSHGPWCSNSWFDSVKAGLSSESLMLQLLTWFIVTGADTADLIHGHWRWSNRFGSW